MTFKDRIKRLDRVKSKDLKANPRNWRKHPDKQRKALVGVLEHVGIADAAIARELDDGTLELIDGHLRSDLDPEQEMPVLVLDVDQREADTLLASIDPLAAMAKTDVDAIGRLVSGMRGGDLDSLCDHLAREYKIPTADEAEEVEAETDRAEELRSEWKTEAGQVWKIEGSQVHRLMCGDATIEDDVAVLLGGDEPFLMVTDPPYGLNYNPNWRIEAAAAGHPCWYGVRKGAKANWIGKDNESTTWKINLDKNVEGGHSTQKPVECMARPIRNHDCVSVYDPFLGSGTTMVAAEQLGRRCYGMEISPAYCAVILQRMKSMGCSCSLEESCVTEPT